MYADELPIPSPRRAVSVALGVTLAALLTMAPVAVAAAGTQAAAADSSHLPATAGIAPQLSIGVDDGRTSAVAGDKLTYSITVRNLGTTDITGLVVTQTVPAGLTLVSAEPAGTTHPGGFGWPLDLKATGKAMFHSTMTVSATPRELLRLATVACASPSADMPPIVCASHSDQLPAGAEVANRATATPAAASSTSDIRWYVGGGVLTVGVLAVLIVLAVRAGRRRGARRAG